MKNIPRVKVTDEAKKVISRMARQKQNVNEKRKSRIEFQKAKSSCNRSQTV